MGRFTSRSRTNGSSGLRRKMNPSYGWRAGRDPPGRELRATTPSRRQAPGNPSLPADGEDDLGSYAGNCDSARDQFYVKPPKSSSGRSDGAPDALAEHVGDRGSVQRDDRARGNRSPRSPTPGGHADRSCGDDYTAGLERGSRAASPQPESCRNLVEGVFAAASRYELSVIEKTEVASYCLIPSPTSSPGRETRRSRWGRRGARGGSGRVPCVRITEVDPIRYKLLFERF